MTQLTHDLVHEALCQKQGGRVSAKKFLRSQGYKFKDSTFSEMCAEVDTGDYGDMPSTPIVGGTVEAPDERRATTSAKTLVLTSAQSNTYLFEPFWESLLTYCDLRDAELHVSQFTYNKGSHGKKTVKPGTHSAKDDEDIWFDPRIEPYVSNEALQITDDLVFCGELNILPTRVNPLSTFKNYTRQASAIIPHAKMAMESVPTMKGDPAKFLYTTGAVTQRNYIQKAAGQVADFHHVFGAIVVEIADDGTWWARQLNADSSGEFYDLDARFTPTGMDPRRYSPSAVTHGDIHMDKLDNTVADSVWGPNGFVDCLRPEQQHFHDLLDFGPRNHHNVKDPFFLAKRHAEGSANVEQEFTDAALFMSGVASRPYSKNVVITSNHDMAIELWLKNPVGATDPENAYYWHQQNALVHTQIRNHIKPRPFANALEQKFREYCADAHIVHEDESYKVRDIECGMHGHLGPNGARGAPKNLRTAGKANTAHTHSAGIVEGVYTAGTYSQLDMGYNKGLSSWSHSCILTYQNGKRAILTIKNGKAWR